MEKKKSVSTDEHFVEVLIPSACQHFIYMSNTSFVTQIKLFKRSNNENHKKPNCTDNNIVLKSKNS